MSEKRKKEKPQDELLETGRTYGSIARTEPDIWTWVEKEAALTGQKKHNIISDALSRYIIEQEVIRKGLTMEQLLAAWDIKDRIEMGLWRKATVFGTQMFTTLLEQVGNLVAGVRATQEERIAEIVEQEKKRDVDYQMKMTQAKLASTLMQAMMPMIMGVLTQMKLPGMPQIQQPQQKEESGVDVEVIE
jgi:hypothetical protein